MAQPARRRLTVPGLRGASRTVPAATVARLPLYLRALVALENGGVATVSSDELATASGVTSTKLRKDLSYLGSYGRRGVGYDVAALFRDRFDHPLRGAFETALETLKREC